MNVKFLFGVFCSQVKCSIPTQLQHQGGWEERQRMELWTINEIWQTLLRIWIASTAFAQQNMFIWFIVAYITSCAVLKIEKKMDTKERERFLKVQLTVLGCRGCSHGFFIKVSYKSISITVNMDDLVWLWKHGWRISWVSGFVFQTRKSCCLNVQPVIKHKRRLISCAFAFSCDIDFSVRTADNHNEDSV